MNSNAAVALYLLRTSEEPMTTTDVAEVVFSPSDNEEVRNAERKVRYYFEDGYDHLVETVEDGSNTEYVVNDDKVWVGNGMMHVSTTDDEVIKVGFGDVLVYMDDCGVPQTVQLENKDVAPTVTPSTSDVETDF